MIDKIKEIIATPLAQQVLFFEEMLTPSVIRLAYWLGLLSVVWIGLGKMFSNGFHGFLEGIVFTVVGALLARVAAEVIILFFKINENIDVIAQNSKIAEAKPIARKVAKKTSKKVTKKTS